MLEAKCCTRDVWIDLTPRFRAAAETGLVAVIVHSALLGGDPISGNSKRLQLRYRLNGRYVEEALGEHSVVLLDLRRNAPTSSTSEVEVIQAWYGEGILGEKGFRDVTDQVRSALQTGTRPVLSGSLPGVNVGGLRYTIIDYRVRGERRLVAVPEGVPISLDVTPTDVNSARSLQVVAASYGAENIWIDLTKRLQQASQNNLLGLLVSNDLVPEDPVQGKTKLLRITYLLNGQRHDATFGEGSFVYLDGRDWSKGNVPRLRARSASPHPSSGLQVHEAFAFRGVLGEKPPVDVTDIVAKELRDNARTIVPNRLPMLASSSAFATIGIIHYTQNDEPRVRLFERHESVTLDP